MGSGIRNISNPDSGSSLVNLRVALLEITLKPSAKFSFFDSRFFRNGSMLIEQINATSITYDPWLLLNPWIWGKNILIYISFLSIPHPILIFKIIFIYQNYTPHIIFILTTSPTTTFPTTPTSTTATPTSTIIIIFFYYYISLYFYFFL